MGRERGFLSEVGKHFWEQEIGRMCGAGMEWFRCKIWWERSVCKIIRVLSSRLELLAAFSISYPLLIQISGVDRICRTFSRWRKLRRGRNRKGQKIDGMGTWLSMVGFYNQPSFLTLFIKPFLLRVPAPVIYSYINRKISYAFTQVVFL